MRGLPGQYLADRRIGGDIPRVAPGWQHSRHRIRILRCVTNIRPPPRPIRLPVDPLVIPFVHHGAKRKTATFGQHCGQGGAGCGPFAAAFWGQAGGLFRPGQQAPGPPIPEPHMNHGPDISLAERPRPCRRRAFPACEQSLCRISALTLAGNRAGLRQAPPRGVPASEPIVENPWHRYRLTDCFP